MQNDMLPHDEPLHSVHTLETDAADAVTNNNLSKARILMANQERRAQELRAPASQGKSSAVKRIFAMGAAIVVLAAASSGVFIFFQQQSQKPPVSTEPAKADQELIAYDVVKEINFADTELAESSVIRSRIYAEAIPPVSGVTFFKMNVDIGSLFLKISPSVPGELYRSIRGKSFFGGMESGNFLIVKVESYEQAYGGMLEWESLMQGDLFPEDNLFPFFGVDSSDTSFNFEDKIVSNKDARIAVDEFDNTLFLYSFYDPTTLVFAKNEEVYRLVSDMLLRKDL